MTNKIGFMQGRLSPVVDGKIQFFPWDNWQEEFQIASELGLNCVDWVLDSKNVFNNPLLDATQSQVISNLEKKSGVKVISVCSDFFMDFPLFNCDSSEKAKRIEFLENLIKKCGELNIPFLEIPCVDHSAFQSDTQIFEFTESISTVASLLEENNVTIAIESSIDAKAFKRLVSSIMHPNIKINYDTGNSASLGYSANEEFDSFGNYIATIHIKDRILGGSTVPLGEGNVEFSHIAHNLKKYKFSGPLILQVARGKDHLQVIKNSMSFLRSFNIIE